MKELSIEEKAKAYDEAIRKLRGMIPNWERLSYNGKTFLQDLIYIFPELKESEDEKVRKELISFLQLPHPQFVGERKQEKWIAWLEKQEGCGQEKYYDTCDSSMMNNKKSPYGEKRDFGYFEEKSADKVGPKFKVGDWIATDNNHIWLIDEDCSTTGYSYRLISQNGKVEVGDYNIVDEHAHLWTIQDAKDGDVLASKDKLNILIFRNLDTSTSFSSYYNIAGKGELGWSNECFIPATKEQRDLLLQKMHESGYEWDADKKELNKIHVIDEGKAEMDYCFTKMMNGEKVTPAWGEGEPQLKEGNFYECIKPYYYLGGGQYWFDKDKVYFCEKDGYLRSDPNNNIYVYDCKNWQSCFRPYTEKSAWTEEDEKMVGNIRSIIEKYAISQSAVDVNGDLCEKIYIDADNWLKSLKQRLIG